MAGRRSRGVPLARLTIGAALVGAVAGTISAAVFSHPSAPQLANPRSAVVPVFQPTSAPTTEVPATPSPSRPAAEMHTAQAAFSTTAAPSASRTATPTLAPRTVYEGNSSTNVLAGAARVLSCPGCPDGEKIGFIGNGGTLTIPDVAVTASGDYALTITYADGDTSGGRFAVVAVNGNATDVYFPGDGNWFSAQPLTMTVYLKAGKNRIEFSNPQGLAPDIAAITV